MDEAVIPPWRSSARCPDDFIENYKKEYEKNEILSKMLDGKTVAYICPGNDAEYTGNHDVVVRVGILKPNTGRTDIIVHSFNQFEMPVALEHVDHIREKFVLCSMVSSDYAEEHDRLFRMLPNHQNVEDEHLYWMFRQVGTVCNVGFSGLLTLLNYGLKEIWISGMTFYNMGAYGKVYSSEYFDVVSNEMKIFKPNTDKTVSALEGRSDLHDQRSQMEYFRKLLETDGRIRLDGYLQDNFR